jgi:hypothetical protein
MRPPRLALLLLATALPSVRAQQAVPPPVAPNAAPAPRVAPPAPGQLEAPPAAPLPAATTELPPRPSLPGEVPRVPVARPRASSSTSTSGQFIVHGDDLALRSAFSSKCEDIATEVRKLLRDTTPWGIPVVVLLNSGESALKAEKAVETIISQIEHGGFHLQVTIHLRPDLRQSDARREIVRALLAERILRDQKQIKAQRSLLLPDWLFTGILEALEFRSRTRPSTLFAAIFKSGRIYGIEEIIEASPVTMDALSRTIYQTSCCALVLALLDQPDGGLRMAKFLTALAADPRTERELLNQHFPAIAGSPSSLNKWWSLQLAALAAPTLSEPLSIADTLEQLDHALTFRYRAKASEVPRPRPVVARVESPRPASPPAAPSASEAGKMETEQAEAEQAEDKPKRSFLSRLNPFARGPKEEDADAVIAAALEEASMEGLVEEPAAPAAEPEVAKTAAPPAGKKEAKAPAEKTEAEKPSAETPAMQVDKPSFLGRLFGRDADPAKVEEPEAPKVEQSDAPKGKEPPAPKVEEEAALKPAPATAIKNEPLPPSPLVAKPKAPEAVVEDDAPVTIIINEPMPPSPATAKAKPAAKSKSEAGAKAEAKTETPPPVEPAPKVEPAEKPSLLNPMNWFRRDEAPEAPAKPGPAAPPAAKDEPAKPATARTALPRTAAWLASVGASSGQPVLAMDFLGLRLGRKKPEATEETPVEPATEAGKDAKTEPKPEAAKAVVKEAAVKEAAVKEAAVKEAAVKEAAVKEAEAKMEAPEADAPAEGDEPRKPSLFRRLLWGDSAKEAAKPDEVLMPEEAKAAEPKPAVAKLTPPKKSAPQPAPPSPADESLVAAEVALEDYAVVLRRPDAKTIFEGNIRELAALQNRAAVLFRPIVTEASQLLADLREGRTKGADTRIRELRRRIRDAETRSKAVRDQLDLHEANETLFMSGVFEDYLKLPETLQKELPERTDPIARYLDALEREFARE